MTVITVISVSRDRKRAEIILNHANELFTKHVQRDGSMGNDYTLMHNGTKYTVTVPTYMVRDAQDHQTSSAVKKGR